MKNLLIFIFAVTCFASCKKDFTCQCTATTVRTTNAGSVQTDQTSTEKFSHVNKKYARERCTSATDTKVTGSGINEVKEEYIRGCTLEQN